jgi:uncharacterized protein
VSDARADRGRATVVVARRVAPGRDLEFQRWLKRLRRAVEKAPGYAGAAFHPPQAEHPDEWLIAYSFDDAAALDRWLGSPERAELIDESSTLIIGEPREQRIAEPTPAGDADTLTLVSSVELRPGAEEEHRARHDDAVAAAERMGGLVRAELLPAVPGVQPETVALFTFRTKDDLDAWLASDERAASLDAIAPLTAGERTVNVVGGFAGWFGRHDVPGPRRWKQALVVLIGLVPLSIASTLAREVVAPGLPLLVGVVVGVLVNVAILTWLVMPRLTRALGSWLAR